MFLTKVLSEWITSWRDDDDDDEDEVPFILDQHPDWIGFLSCYIIETTVYRHDTQLEHAILILR